MDRSLARIGPVWQTEPSEGRGNHGWPSAAELAIAKRLIPGSGQANREVEQVVSRCSSPERARRALEFATRSEVGLVTDVSSDTGYWGGALAIAFGDRRCFVPSSTVLEELDRAATRLDSRLERRKRYRERRTSLALAAMDMAFRELDADVVFPLDAGTGRPFVLIRPDERHLLLLDVVTGADRKHLDEACWAAATSLADISPTTEWWSPIGPWPVARQSEILRFVVADCPTRVIIDTERKPIVVTLCDLRYVISRVEDAVELWEFLAEIDAPPRIGRLVSPGVPELFEVWNDHGSLNTIDVEAPEAVIGFSTFLDVWRESAAWEPFDAVLAHAGQPSSAHLNRRRLSRDGEAQLWSLRPKALTIVRQDPELVLDVPLDNLGSLDIQIVADFATSLSTAAIDLDAFGRALKACGTGVRIVIAANSEPPPDPNLGPADPWIGWAGLESPSPLGSLRFDYRLLALFSTSPAEAREVLGTALSHMLSEMGASGRSAIAAKRAWKEWGSGFSATVTTGVPSRPFQVARMSRHYDTMRVAWALHARLREQGVKPAVYLDAEAITFCDRQLTSNLYAMLVEQVARFDHRQLVVRGLNEVGAALADRRRQLIELRTGLSAPWGDQLRIDESVGSQESLKWTRSVELVLELAIRSEGRGRRTCGRIDWARLLAIATSLTELSQIRAQARFFEERIAIEVDDERRVSVQAGDSTNFAVMAFDVCRRLFSMRPSEEPDESDLSAGSDGESEYEQLVHSMDGSNRTDDDPFESLIDHPATPNELRALDLEMRSRVGTGFDAILATLRTARSWPRDPGSEYATVTVRELVKNVKTWSRLPESEITTAVELLRLSRSTLQAEDAAGAYPYWLLEQRSARCSTRPFIEAGARRLLIVPELAAGTQMIVARYLQDGRVPWPEVAKTLLRPLRNFRRWQNLRLEQLAEEQLRLAGYLVKRSLEPQDLRRFGVPIDDSVGEIDLVVVDAARRKLWVFEAKDPEESFSIHDLSVGAKEFRTKYVDQLNRKYAGVVQCRAELIAHLGGDAGGDWSIHKAFLVSRVELAAFDRRVDEVFVVLDDIVELVDARSIDRARALYPSLGRVDCSREAMAGDFAN